MALVCTNREEYRPGTDTIDDGYNWCHVLTKINWFHAGSTIQAIKLGT